MAISATLTRIVSSIVKVVNNKQDDDDDNNNNYSGRASSVPDLPRRRILLSTLFLAAADSRTELLQKYLKKSQENKGKYDKEVNFEFMHFITTYQLLIC
ncbi:hypothetical protein AgCh_028436 [Apium graveolens]